MQKKVTADERAKKVDDIIRIAFDSLKTHLPYTHHVKKTDMAYKETVFFHRKCVKEYAKIIQLASELY